MTEKVIFVTLKVQIMTEKSKLWQKSPYYDIKSRICDFKSPNYDIKVHIMTEKVIFVTLKVQIMTEKSILWQKKSYLWL